MRSFFRMGRGADPVLIQFPVKLVDQFGGESSAVAQVVSRTQSQAFWAGAKKSGKIVGIAGLAALPFAFLEPFLFLGWGTLFFLFLAVVLGPYLHMKFAAELQSVQHVSGECPHCHVEGRLSPFVSTRWSREFTVLCSGCGQTTRVQAPVDPIV